MRLFRLLSWPYLRRHVLRWTLTLSGIVLGVAVFIAMNTANRSIFHAFDQTVDQIAGATQLQVTAGEFGFEESTLERVQAVPEVGVAVPVIESIVDMADSTEGSLMLLGIDMTGDRSLRDYALADANASAIDDPLVFLAQPDSLMVTADFARRHGLTAGRAISLRTIQGDRPFTVRGIPNRYAYGATKAAVIGLTKAVAADFIRKGIRCNAICPGTIESPSLEQRMQDLVRSTGKPLQAVEQAFVERQPMGRLGKAEEVARLAVFLASDESSYITGQPHLVDGGMAL